MGGKSKSSKQTSMVRYAPYIESKHSAFLDNVANTRALLINSSPFANYGNIEYLSGFFGVGYTIASFPSLYDMFGKFMAGLDVDSLFTQVMNNAINNQAVNNRVAAHSVELSDEVDNVTIPKLLTGMRDINAVMSSSFVIARTIIEGKKLKTLSKYDAELRAAMIPAGIQAFGNHLNWNSDVIKTYIEIMKTYFNVAHVIDSHNSEVATKDKLWPFTVLDFERVAIAALQGATRTSSDVAGASQASKAIGSGMIGAAAGAMIPGFGAAGAVIGGVIGLASAFI